MPPKEAPPVDAEACPPYLPLESTRHKRRVFLETYGCQMNFNDSEIVLGILKASGNYERTERLADADTVLLMTCAIRENAEDKVWNRLEALRAHQRQTGKEMTIGVLGCMAERLKETLLERQRTVDLVCGPDAYKDLPNLLRRTEGGHTAINVLLSADETYADVAPVRLDDSRTSAFVSIMRGCNNMCAFCIVPFTRGRERSRPVDSILAEVDRLVGQGVREVTLLGQNVNSYCDGSANDGAAMSQPVEGFSSVFKGSRVGLTFARLLDRLSDRFPDTRFRFTSPHPKDFPDDLLHLMAERPNICKSIHLPAQSGSSQVLDRMRRGYSRETYLRLVEHIRSIVPQVTLSSDFIVGFCGETEEDHRHTLSLVQAVDYDMAYMFAYSMREKTMAHRRYVDDVPAPIKQRRLRELIDIFYGALKAKVANSVGQQEILLVEGPSKKDLSMLSGRSDGNRMTVFAPRPVPSSRSGELVVPQVGDYVVVKIDSVIGATPIGVPVAVLGGPLGTVRES